MTSSFRFFVKRKTIPVGPRTSPSTRGSGGGHAWPRYLYQSRNERTTSDIYRAGGNDDASSEHFDHGLHLEIWMGTEFAVSAFIHPVLWNLRSGRRRERSVYLQPNWERSCLSGMRSVSCFCLSKRLSTAWTRQTTPGHCQRDLGCRDCADCVVPGADQQANNAEVGGFHPGGSAAKPQEGGCSSPIADCGPHRRDDLFSRRRGSFRSERAWMRRP